MPTSDTDMDFDDFRVHYKESVERMFAATSKGYAGYWDDLSHLAIFQDDNQSWGAAFQQTHEKYLEALRIAHARNVLELGRGRGGFSAVLAQNTEGTVLGIDITRAQASDPNSLERSNLRYGRHDIMKVDHLRETFDAVACIDAACYLPDKARAIGKLSKVMEPGARFLLVDWCKREGLSHTQEELVLYPFMKSRAIPGLETADSYRMVFRRSGLTVIEASDLNDRVKRNCEFAYARGLTAVREMRNSPGLLSEGTKLGSVGIRRIKEQLLAAVSMKIGFDAGFLRYVYFVAERDS